MDAPCYSLGGNASLNPNLSKTRGSMKNLHYWSVVIAQYEHRYRGYWTRDAGSNTDSLFIKLKELGHPQEAEPDL